MLGVSIEGEEKNRLGVTSALSEIWDLAVFQSVHFFIKEENPENHGAKKKKERDAHAFEEVTQKNSVQRLSAGGSVGICGVRSESLSPNPPVRARACVRVFTSVWTTAKRRREENAKEGGMVDNSSSSKAQMVSRGSASRPFALS